MAASIGSLVVRLSLDAAEFTSGLAKSEYEARKFAKAIDDGIRTAAGLATIALSAMASAGTATVIAINDLAKQAGNFQDLAEKTGANAEALASFSVAAQTAGSNMEEVANFSIKLSKNLAGVDDESKAAGAALTAMGIPIKEFKSLKPEEQIERLAKALAGFSDEGGGKTAALEAIAKGGAQLLPFLKELEQQGGRQVILTQEQIRQADEYSDKQSRARAELNLYAQVMATQALPAITSFTTAAKETIAEIIGVDREGKKLRDSDAITEFANNTVRALGFVISSGQGLGRVFEVVGQTIAAGAAQTASVARGDLKGAIAIGRDWQNQIDQILQKQLFSAKLEKQIKDQQSQSNDGRNAVATGGKKPLAFSGALGGGGTAAKDRTSDADRYAESLAKTLQGTLNLTTAETALAEIYVLRQSTLSGLTPALEQTIRDYAQQIDTAKEVEKQERAAALAEQEAERIRANIRKEAQSAQRDAQSIVDSNEQIRAQIILLKEGQAALDAYTAAKLLKAAAERDDLAASLASIGASDDLVAAIKAQATALRDQKQLLADKSAAESYIADQKAMQEALGTFYDDAANALLQFTSGTATAKDAFRSFVTSIVQDINKMALASIKDSLLGTKSGPNIFDLIPKLLGAFGGGGGGSSGSTNLDFSDAHYANGTKYAPGGLSWVGEHGPELRYIPRGAQVIPNHDLSSRIGGYGREIHMTQQISVAPGANTSSIRQAARRGGQLAAMQLRRG